MIFSTNGGVNFLLEHLDYMWRNGAITDAEKRKITVRIHKLPIKWERQDKEAEKKVRR